MQKWGGQSPPLKKPRGGRPPASDATAAAAAIGWGMLEFVEISGAASVQFLVVARGDEAAVPGERLDVRRRHVRRAPLIRLATAPAVADGVDGRRGDGQRGGGPVESSRQHGRRLRLVLVEIVHPQVVAGFVVAVFTAQRWNAIGKQTEMKLEMRGKAQREAGRPVFARHKCCQYLHPYLTATHIPSTKTPMPIKFGVFH